MWRPESSASAPCCSESATVSAPPEELPMGTSPSRSQPDGEDTSVALHDAPASDSPRQPSPSQSPELSPATIEFAAAELLALSPSPVCSPRPDSADEREAVQGGEGDDRGRPPAGCHTPSISVVLEGVVYSCLSPSRENPLTPPSPPGSPLLGAARTHFLELRELIFGAARVHFWRGAGSFQR